MGDYNTKNKYILIMEKDRFIIEITLVGIG